MGYSSVPLLVTLIPIMLAVFLVCVEAIGVAYTWVRADLAAHAAADEAAIGGDPVEAAQASLGEGLRADAEVEVVGNRVRVAVLPPTATGLGRATGAVVGEAALGDGAAP